MDHLNDVPAGRGRGDSMPLSSVGARGRRIPGRSAETSSPRRVDEHCVPGFTSRIDPTARPIVPGLPASCVLFPVYVLFTHAFQGWRMWQDAGKRYEAVRFVGLRSASTTANRA